MLYGAWNAIDDSLSMWGNLSFFMLRKGENPFSAIADGSSRKTQRCGGLYLSFFRTTLSLINKKNRRMP